MFAIKTILHPTDFSERSERALRIACSLASDYRAHLVLMHVVSRPPLFSRGLLFDPKLANHCAEALQPVKDSDAASEILRVACVCQADLIVMAAHACRPIVGSIVEEVVRRASCPVLTVTAPNGHEQANHRFAVRASVL